MSKYQCSNRNLGVTFDGDFYLRKHISLTCRSCFYHICDLRLIQRYITLVVAKTIATPPITSRLEYCNSLLYNSVSKDILKLQCVENCLSRWSSCSVLDHGSLRPVLKSRRGHIWRLFHPWLRFITFGGRSARLSPTLCAVVAVKHQSSSSSATIWKLTSSDLPILPRFSLHLIICGWT